MACAKKTSIAPPDYQAEFYTSSELRPLKSNCTHGALAETEEPQFDHGSVHQFGVPPKGNADFAWVQHMLRHLTPHGSMALLLANGSMSSNTKGEGDIRNTTLLTLRLAA